MVEWILLNTVMGRSSGTNFLESSLTVFIFFDMIVSPLRIYFKEIIRCNHYFYIQLLQLETVLKFSEVGNKEEN